jgi:hypothetical protein
MKAQKLILLALALVMAGTAMAQKVKLREGNLSPLKGTSKLSVRYTYDGMTVTTKNRDEDEFIQDKRDEYNKKEAGKGDAWAAAWKADRQKRYEPQFKEQFDKQSGMEVGNFPDAMYTLIFKTTHTETGYNIGISRRNAYIDGEVWIVETANPDRVIAKISVDDCAGRQFGGYDFDTGERVKEAYAVAGKGVGKFIKKKI